MENHIIRKEDGTIMKWDKSKTNNYFCLLHSDNKQKYYFTPAQDLKCSVFMIGGGGAGGYYFGGGGGAGAAYINDNFTFKKNISYSFEIGTGGRCDIDNVNNLFQSGLNLKVFNNITPKLTNIKFTGNDYSSLGITTASIVQSFITENINIPSTIFNNNTTYIWDGYIKPVNNFIRITVNSKIKVMIWVDKTVYDNSSAIVDGIVVNDVKVLQLDTSKYFNIKIIAYNFDTANSDFNIKFEDCDLFNFNKNGEVYNYTQATDTSIIYRTADDKPYIIKCKGGGNGGCGLYNQNQNLDGGCGGGSGINKKNGKAIVDPSFNGNHGGVGTYCGGGGGILSAGNNNKGGKGKTLEWFNDKLIFGAGGHGANTKEDRTLGYGSGGNGADCCKFSKLDINNDGNNGCVLIYFKTAADVIEKFTDNSDELVAPSLINSGKTHTYVTTDSIVYKLISQSFTLFNNPNTKIIQKDINRIKYFEQIGQDFASLCFDDGSLTGLSDTQTTAPISIVGGNNDMNNFIYDMFVASKLFAVIYRLYYHKFKVEFKSDISKFETFVKQASINFGGSNTSIAASNNVVNIKNLFDISNLNLNTSNPSYRNDIYCGGDLSMAGEVYDELLNDIGSNIPIPLYHNASDNYNKFESTGAQWYNSNYNTANKKMVNKINPIITGASDNITITAAIINNNLCDSATTLPLNSNLAVVNYEICASSSDVILPLNYGSSLLSSDRLKQIYNTNFSTLNGNKNEYKYQRILFHLENFNIILNTDPNIILNILKYYMYYYNSVVYNVILQYNLFLLQKNRVRNFRGAIRTQYSLTAGAGGNLYTSAAVTNAGSNTYGYIEEDTLTATNPASTLATLNIMVQRDINAYANNLEIIYKSINNSQKYIEMIKKINNNTYDIKNIGNDFDEYQTKYNKVVNVYNNDLDTYKTMNNYYKAVIVITIIIIIMAIFLFTIPNIDGNAQTGILLITAVIMILFYIFYLINFKPTETFVNCNYKDAVVTNAYSTDLSFTTYKTNLFAYNTFLLILASGFSITGDTLTPVNDFVDQANNMRRRRILAYKNKIAQYSHASELLKKNADNYYYLMTLIYFSIVIALIAMSFYLLFPTMIFTVIIFAFLIFLILLIYVVYRINRTTRLYNDKNYWANFNPTPEVVQLL
jgi:hypothetical protein